MTVVVVESVAVGAATELAAEEDVLDAGAGNRLCEWVAIKLRRKTAVRVRAHVDQHLDALISKQREKAFQQMIGVADGQQARRARLCPLRLVQHGWILGIRPASAAGYCRPVAQLHGLGRSVQPQAAIRLAAELPLSWERVEECLTPADDLFRRAWRGGLGALTTGERQGRLPSDTGFIAEAVATLVFRELGLDVFAQIVTPGVHGVDLLALTAEESVLALEVKGTLRPGGLPRLSSGALRQMSVEWLNDPKNPAMAEWELQAADIYGGVAVFDFARASWRAALTSDFETFTPVLRAHDLLTPSRLP